MVLQGASPGGMAGEACNNSAGISIQQDHRDVGTVSAQAAI